jgi:hypothetical protein
MLEGGRDCLAVWAALEPFSAFCVLLQINAKLVLIAFFKPESDEAAGSRDRRYAYGAPSRSGKQSFSTLIMTLADLDRLNPLPCMDVCPVCGSDQVHGRACIATRLFRTIKRLAFRRREEIKSAIESGSDCGEDQQQFQESARRPALRKLAPVEFKVA